ncbi:YchJ family protein [Sphingobacterium griseoflavum]|uniref:Preprotein translocase SecA n=1 Tax=Sphingobacterium griseoflavum TaxID=1474952 RepID=A0ABQ3HUA5_9SPHI|nr:YchJ family metal-binding protein [Sphingobacterium griseoflavum]GHE34238.1 preprotein translocase SecA [Sphingobacterium griseoflavum]
MMQTCHCGTSLSYPDCCGKIHENLALAGTAEELMRARYTAFSLQLIDFLYDSFHPSTRRFQQKKDIEQWAKSNKWMQLEILNSTLSTVEFRAHYLDPQFQVAVHHEKSNFRKLHGLWYYVDGSLC